MKQKPLTFQSLEEFAKPAGIKPCELHGLKNARNRLRRIREQLPEEPQTMADPLNEKPTLQSTYGTNEIADQVKAYIEQARKLSNS